jgi:D-3-phosphoglycerate dehydrogenase / 2-oxoglutarate reductase
MPRYQILTLNNISHSGLKRLPAELYAVGNQIQEPDAILVRSHDMNKISLPACLKAIGRAGAGINNIPVKQVSLRGVPVFNTPGANANAVKELVLAGLLLAARNIVPALRFVEGLTGDDSTLHKLAEEGKKQFSGIELAGQTLGIIGLGKVGCLVADAGIKLGLNVLGYDPEITVDAAWSLPSQVKKAHSIEEVLKTSDFVTLHVPLIEVTRGLIGAQRVSAMKHRASLLNFARDAVVDTGAVLDALNRKQLNCYVCDFPSSALAGHPAVVALPHIGASTREAEDNCAVMVVDQIRAYLEHGNIVNAVNFPGVLMPRESPYRVGIANANVPNMVGQISTAMAAFGLNIHNMMNKSRGEMAYTLLDVDSPVPDSAIAQIAAIAGVLSVRYLPALG